MLSTKLEIQYVALCNINLIMQRFGIVVHEIKPSIMIGLV
jgi:hypothetical protein